MSEQPKVTRNLSDPESRAYWESLEKIASEPSCANCTRLQSALSEQAQQIERWKAKYEEACDTGSEARGNNLQLLRKLDTVEATLVRLTEERDSLRIQLKECQREGWK